jgi:hypothetical protein
VYNTGTKKVPKNRSSEIDRLQSFDHLLAVSKSEPAFVFEITALDLDTENKL